MMFMLPLFQTNLTPIRLLLKISRATGERIYLEKSEMMYRNFFLTSSWAFSWDNKTAGVQLLLYRVTKKSAYGQAIQKYLRNWLPGNPTSKCQNNTSTTFLKLYLQVLFQSLSFLLALSKYQDKHVPYEFSDGLTL